MEANEQIKIWNYAKRGEKARAIQIGGLTLYFSYSTIIAFRDEQDDAIIKNYWGATTGGHLNSINEDKSKRIDDIEFNKRLKKCLQRHNLLL